MLMDFVLATFKGVATRQRWLIADLFFRHCSQVVDRRVLILLPAKMLKAELLNKVRSAMDARHPVER